MPEFTFTSPSGQSYTMTGPEGSTKEQAFEKFKSMKPELFGAATEAAPDEPSRGTVGAGEAPAAAPERPRRKGVLKNQPEAEINIPTLAEVGQQWRDVAVGAPKGAVTAIPGLPFDVAELVGFPNKYTSSKMADYMFGPAASPSEAGGRAFGGMFAGPVAGGLSKVAAAAKAAELPKIAKLAQGASTVIDPLSPTISGAVNVVKNALRPAEAATPTTNALRAAAEADYAVMDSSNLAIHPDVLRSTIADIKKSLEKSRYVEELDPTARNFLQVLETRAQTPQSLTQIDAMRGKARDLAYDASGGEHKVLSTISRRLDDALSDINPSNIVPKDPLLPAAVPDTVKDALVSARDKFRTAAKSAEIETLIHRADVSTTDNPIKALRTQFSSLAKNEDRLAQYTPAEQKVIKDIADGNIGSKSLQTLENLMPGFSRTSMFGNIMAALAGAAGSAATGPFGSLFFAAPGAIGKAAESARAAQAMPIANKFAEGIRARNVGNALAPQGVSPSAVRNFLSPGAMMYSGTNQ